MFIRKLHIMTLSALFMISLPFLTAQDTSMVTWNLDHLNLEGYYKHALLNGGPGVNAPPRSHFEALGLTYEHIDTRECNSHWSNYRNLFIGGQNDTNGMLLYPDGSNRFALMTVGGAAAEQHVNDDCSDISTGSWVGGGGRFSDFLRWNQNPLGQSGDQIVDQFMRGGGAYSGFCAGSSLMDRGGLRITNYSETTLIDADNWRFDIEGDQLAPYLGNLTRFYGPRSIGGGALPTHNGIPDGAEIIYYGLGSNDDNQWQWAPVIWSWEKNNADYGRMVVSGAHPENAEHVAEAFALTAAMYSYALDGGGGITLKSNDLVNGNTRTMDRETEDNQPDYTKIGDKQIHHFTFDVTNSNDRYLMIQLEGALNAAGQEIYDFRLYLNRDRPAFPSDHLYVGEGSISNKTIYLENVSNLATGTWYVGVELFTSVEMTKNSWGEYRYTGETDVLNGIAYDLTATWSNSPIVICNETINNLSISSTVLQNANSTITWDSDCLDPSRTVKIDLLSAGGSVIRTLVSSVNATNGVYTWNTNQTPGSYRLRVSANHNTAIQATSNTFQIISEPPSHIIEVFAKGTLVNGTLYFDKCERGANCTNTLFLKNTGSQYSIVGATVVDSAGNPSNLFQLSSSSQVSPFINPFPAQMFMSLGAGKTISLNVSYSGGSYPGPYFLELQSSTGEMQYQQISLCVGCR